MDRTVSLVIPGRNCAATLESCLRAALPLKKRGALATIVFVDDGSTDDTRAIASRFDVTVVPGPGRGAAAARNVGWRRASTSLIWFVDSDCVIEPDTLDRLLPSLVDERVGAVGGSYTNRCPDSLLACLIHEEIVARHARMSAAVDFLGGFNVIYKRSVLEAVGGFDERYPAATAEDADISFRVRKAGFNLRFEPAALVGHYHETSLIRYLSTQRRHAFWRVRLHLDHRREGIANAYSSAMDHLQPPLAVLVLVGLPFLFIAGLRWVPLVPAVLLLLMQMPMTVSLMARTRSMQFLAFAALGFVRSFWRGVGLIHGLIAMLTSRG
jgi:GT2 family glycosyltransferase